MADSTGFSSSDSPPPVNNTDARTGRDSIKKGFNNIVKFADTNYSRAKQYVTEKAGKADVVTEYDSEIEEFCGKMDQIKLTTERMLYHIETLVQPNPNIRLEDWARTKLDRPKPRSNSYDSLGKDLTRASESFGPESQYGAYLLQCGGVEIKLGESRRRFEEKVAKDVITPLKAFMEVDIKSILRERKVLSVKRLDLDARKASNRKAQGNKVATTEVALRSAQADYDQQLEKVRKSLKKLVESHASNMGYLHYFMSAQKAFHEECQEHLMVIGATGLSPMSASLEGMNEREGSGHEVTILYDYTAVNSDEISIDSGEVVRVHSIPGDTEYVMAQHNGETGKIPTTYIEYM